LLAELKENIRLSKSAKSEDGKKIPSGILVETRTIVHMTKIRSKLLLAIRLGGDIQRMDAFRLNTQM
jgi:hypothetical protein